MVAPAAVHLAEHYTEAVSKQLECKSNTPGGDFGPLGRRNQASLVLWLIFVEWDIDLGSTFCKYLPRGRREGPSTAAERKQPLFLFKAGAARVRVLLESG